MAKTRRKQPATSALDCPPERLQHDPSGFVNPATIDSAEQNIGRNRRMVTPRIDVLYNMGAVTWVQKFAADWWNARIEEGLGLPRLCADYGQSNGGGSADPSPLPLSNNAERARRLIHQAKADLPAYIRATIEEAVERDPIRLEGRAATARLARWRVALDALYAWIAKNS